MAFLLTQAQHLPRGSCSSCSERRGRSSANASLDRIAPIDDLNSWSRREHWWKRRSWGVLMWISTLSVRRVREQYRAFQGTTGNDVHKAEHLFDKKGKTMPRKISVMRLSLLGQWEVSNFIIKLICYASLTIVWKASLRKTPCHESMLSATIARLQTAGDLVWKRFFAQLIAPGHRSRQSTSSLPPARTSRSRPLSSSSLLARENMTNTKYSYIFMMFMCFFFHSLCSPSSRFLSHSARRQTCTARTSSRAVTLERREKRP